MFDCPEVAAEHKERSRMGEIRLVVVWPVTTTPQSAGSSAKIRSIKSFIRTFGIAQPVIEILLA